MLNQTFGTEFQGKILTYTSEFDAKRTAQKIKDGIKEFGWNNKEIQPCLTMVEPHEYKGIIISL